MNIMRGRGNERMTQCERIHRVDFFSSPCGERDGGGWWAVAEELNQCEPLFEPVNMKMVKGLEAGVRR